MTNNSSQQTTAVPKTGPIQQAAIPRLSDDAFYVLALVSQLKKLLGPASLQQFLATGESVGSIKKAC